MKTHAIPTKKQWAEAWEGLDEAFAFKHFYNKTLQEAKTMLIKSSELYCEDFTYMPKVPFQFYFKAFKSYLISNESKYDEYAANSFITLVKYKIEYKYEWIKYTWQSILYVLQRLIKKAYQYDYFEKKEMEIRIKEIVLRNV